MNALTRCLSQCVNYTEQPFLWHVKNAVVHRYTTYAVSRWAQVSYPSHVAFVATTFYAVMSCVWQMGWGLKWSLWDKRKSINFYQASTSSQRIMRISDLHAQDKGNNNMHIPPPKAFPRLLVRMWPSIPVLAIASVVCHRTSLRMGLKLPELFRFLGILWINGSVSECLICHVDNIGDKFFNGQKSSDQVFPGKEYSLGKR